MKLRNFHESYAGGEIKPPSERSTGLLFAAVAVIVAVLWRNSPVVPWVALAIAVGMAAVSLFAPVLLKPLNILWFQFGLLLHRVVNPIVMFAMFAAGVRARRHASCVFGATRSDQGAQRGPRPIGSSAGKVETLKDP